MVSQRRYREPERQIYRCFDTSGSRFGWNSPGLLIREKRDGMKPELSMRRRYVHADRGTVQIIPVPDEDELGPYSIAVAENNHMSLQGNLLAAGAGQQKPDLSAVPRPIPVRAGEPSTIDHVVYIIKENRSYDQYFGSLGKGNGDPSLDTYGDDIIPNQRKLARDFVLLDNFYANGGNSADGHQWVTQAAENGLHLLARIQRPQLSEEWRRPTRIRRFGIPVGSPRRTPQDLR